MQAVRLFLCAGGVPAPIKVMVAFVHRHRETYVFEPICSVRPIALSTVSMDGKALERGFATVFLAQAFQMGLSIPAIVLEEAGIPTAGFALVLGVDRIPDMSRTAVNATGDVTACRVLDRWMGGEDAAA